VYCAQAVLTVLLLLLSCRTLLRATHQMLMRWALLLRRA
jgi:hypothetical protein